MSRSPELDLIKSKEQAAFQRKQDLHQQYTSVKDRCNEAYEIMEVAWKERKSAEKVMNREYEIMQKLSENNDAIWNEYGRIRDRNNLMIESLRRNADYEHGEMQNYFDRASSAYSCGDYAGASSYSQQGRMHQTRRNQLNAEVSVLCQEVKNARQEAELRAPKTDSSSFKQAQLAFKQAKSRHEAAEGEFKCLKQERNRLQKAFQSAHAEHLRLKDEFEQKLKEVKVQKATNRQLAIDKVNMALVRSNAHYLGTLFGQNAKIVPKRDGSGKTDVYFGGLEAAGDGIGHGHAVIDKDGNVTYLRDAWVADKKNDYLIDDRAGWNKTHKI